MKTRMILLSITTLVLAASLYGCGSSKPETEVKAPPVDPRFVSAEALVNYINSSLVKIAESNDLNPAKELLHAVYAENEDQRRVVSLFSHIEAVIDLFNTASSKFGADFTNAFNPGSGGGFGSQGMGQGAGSGSELNPGNPGFGGGQGLNPGNPSNPGNPGFGGQGSNQEQQEKLTPPKATIKEIKDRRVIVTLTDEAGEETDIHLVELDNRWWISGYSFERHPDFEEFFNSPEFPKMENFLSSVSKEAKDLQGKIESGELSSQDQFFMAMMDSMMKLMTDNPEMQELFDNFTGGGDE